jgi:hypothetical protein
VALATYRRGQDGGGSSAIEARMAALAISSCEPDHDDQRERGGGT